MNYMVNTVACSSLDVFLMAAIASQYRGIIITKSNLLNANGFGLIIWTLP